MTIIRASFVFLLIAARLAAPVVAAAQRVPTIGLSTGTDPIKPNPVWIQFLDQLGQLGYVEGRNIAIERRFAGGRYERVAEFVTDLGARQVDVIVATGDVESLAAKRGLPTTPVVMMLVQDPIHTGLVASLARPGGNVTGLTTQAPELYSKRLELLKEALPAVRRVGVLFNPASASVLSQRFADKSGRRSRGFRRPSSSTRTAWGSRWSGPGTA
jgi:putative tryptophan/tyrosine transport system substrate-binding protein